MRESGQEAVPESVRRRVRSALARRRLLVLMRGLNAAALGALVLDARPGPLEAGVSILLAIIALSSLLIALVPGRIARTARFHVAIGLADLVLLGVGIKVAGLAFGPLLLSGLLMIVALSIASDGLHATCGALAVLALHAWMAASTPRGLAGDTAIELILLASAGGYYGMLASRVRGRRPNGARRQADEEMRQEIAMIQELLDAIHQARDLRAAAYAIVSRLAALVPAVRCSLVCIDERSSRCWVLASHEEPDLPLIEVNLADYPEMRRAIETRDPILIQDTLSDPVTRPVRDRLAALDFHRIMVIPIAQGRDLLGLLCVRGTAGHERFGRREINLCTLVARACSGALQDALEGRAVARAAG